MTSMVDPAAVRNKPSLSFLIRLVVKVTLALAAVFGLVRIAAPNLMDMHSDLAFWVGVACWPAALILGLAAVAWIRRDFMNERRHQGAPGRLFGPE